MSYVICKTKATTSSNDYHYGFNLSPTQVVGMGKKWTGGDVVRYPGGGQKINLLKPVLEKWKDDKNLIIMFVDR